MKLGVCIIQLPFLKGDLEKTKETILSLPCETEIHVVSSFVDAQLYLQFAKEDWVLILYSYEALDACFIDCIEVMLDEKSMDAYRFLCLIKTSHTPRIVENVRLIRNGIKLLPKKFELEDTAKAVTRILDGWIFEHGTEKQVHLLSQPAAVPEIIGESANSC